MARPASGTDGAPSSRSTSARSSAFGSTAIEVVGQRGEPGDRLLPAHRDADRHAALGQVPDARRLDPEVLAVVVDELARVERADHLDRLLEHVLARGDSRPARADHVLVEVLPAAEAEGEPAVGEQLDGRGLLRDHGRVVARRRAGHVGHEVDPLRRVGDGAEDAPGVGRMTLSREPREVVVAHDLEVEARLLGADRPPHEVLGSALFGHQGVADAHR